MSPPRLSPEILARYGGERVPRYTSYPTAPHFTEAVDTAVYRHWLGAVPAGTEASLYLHIPFCRSMCWYCGCHTTITRQDAPIGDYLGLLRREIGLVSSALPGQIAAGHVHFGGGTPTILQPAAFLGLLDLLRDAFSLREGAELAVEIDPRTLTTEMAAALGRGGITRASLGVQSFDPEVQRAVNRVQSYAQTAHAVERLRAAGIAGINLDLIYGLPLQTVRSCRETVREALRLAPDRFAVFGYAHVPGFKPHQRKIDEAALPDAEERWAQFEAISEALEEAGYVPIGLDHFARPADPLAVSAHERRLRRNFQGYTTDGCEVLLAFGASAIGRLPQGYVQNAPVLGTYAKRIGAGELATVKGRELTAEDRRRARAIEQLMCDFRAEDAVELVTVPEALARMADDGLVLKEGRSLVVPRHARPLVRSLAALLDPYLAAGQRRHAPAV
jgi:oxygen-independent coproporphyrinogen-3 oxidase